MGITITGPDNNGLYTTHGTTAGFKVAVFFGILLLVIGFIMVFANPIVGAIFLFMANMILFLNNRHKKLVCQKLINEYAHKLDSDRMKHWE